MQHVDPSSPKTLFYLFLTGFIQISLVSMNIRQIADHEYLGAFICSALIGIVWSINVKRVAFGGWLDRITYGIGCGTGCVIGLQITNLIYV